MSDRRVFAIVVAAGSGDRFGGTTPKQLMEIRGTTVVQLAVAAIEAGGGVDDIVVVTRADLIERVAATVSGARVIAGGVTRAASVRSGLAALEGHEEDIVLVHDAARPLVGPGLVTAVVAATRDHGAATPALPVGDTLLEAEDGSVVAVPDRARLLRAQTPQGFLLGILRSAHDRAAADADFEPTDDCAVVRRYRPDVRIAVIAGSDRNIKITTPADLQIAESILSQRGA
ncbi:MAG: 2-C-methyl-D-erythritol 4-phosphate cytidylyltransferase [Acidimicrobiia bacterium]